MPHPNRIINPPPKCLQKVYKRIFEETQELVLSLFCWEFVSEHESILGWPFAELS